MSNSEPSLQDLFLNHLRKSHSSLALYLLKGVRLQGVLTAFDPFSVELRRDGSTQLVYKHAIATIGPIGLSDRWDNPTAAYNPSPAVQDQFLTTAGRQSAVDLYLMSGVMLSGKVLAFDQFSILLEREQRLQLIYKHAISTIQMDNAEVSPVREREGAIG